MVSKASELRMYLLGITQPETPLVLVESVVQSLMANGDTIAAYELFDNFGTDPRKTGLSLWQISSDLIRILKSPEPPMVRMMMEFDNWAASLENLDAARVAFMNSDHTTKEAARAAKSFAEIRELEARRLLFKVGRDLRDHTLSEVMAVQP